MCDNYCQGGFQMREMIRHNEGYMPVLAEAAATAVRTRREEDFQFVLNMLEKSYITGEKFICPYGEGDTPRQLKRPIVQVGEHHFLLVFTSSEAALQFDCMKVMEESVAEVVQMVCESEEVGPLDGLAINLHSEKKGPVPCIILKNDLQKINQKCKDVFEQFIIPQMMEMHTRNQINF